ncbi:MAG: YjjG family noncanonical pyrimidine nucleotidase [Bacteroidales bacterium]|nr:YjjG family noncanonical pyrimidine nucleotidase [Bacteroidales bacterium]
MGNRKKSDKHYKHIFFDLDNTLWDYKTNMKETFAEIVRELNLKQIQLQFDEFVKRFEKTNDQYWIAYRKGLISKDFLRRKRFSDTLESLGIYDELIVDQIADLYHQRVSRKANLFPGVHETLAYLKEKYKLYIITNGFVEIQTNKLESAELSWYFDRIFMAEATGYRKPDKRFFQYALSSVNAKKDESIMVGDDPEADILGARDTGIDQVFFNPAGIIHKVSTTYEIRFIEELKKIL